MRGRVGGGEGVVCVCVSSGVRIFEAKIVLALKLLTPP